MPEGFVKQRATHYTAPVNKNVLDQVCAVGRFLFSVRFLPLMLLLFLGGCASHHHQEELKTELEVLKVQMARHQEILVRQAQLMESLTEYQQSGQQERQAFQGQLMERFDALESAQRPRDPDPQELECPLALSDGPRNGENCTDLIFLGEIEYVRLTPPDRAYDARIDTGATTSSMDARDIQTFERDGEDYVRFSVPATDYAEEAELELPVVRFVRIVQSSEEEGERRPVVELQLELGPVERMFEFTLTDREHLSYPVLIGRNALRDLFVVDVGEQYVTRRSGEIRESLEEEQSRAEED